MAVLLLTCFASTAAVSTAAGHSLRLPYVPTSGSEPRGTGIAADGGPMSMLSTNTDVQADVGADHPLSWLFGNAAPAGTPVAFTGTGSAINAAMPAVPAMQVTLPGGGVVANTVGPTVHMQAMPVAPPSGLTGTAVPVSAVSIQEPMQTMPVQLAAQLAAQQQMAPPTMPGMVSPYYMPMQPGFLPMSAFRPTAAPTPPPAPPPPPPPSVAPEEVAQMRTEIAQLRQEVVAGSKDMWNAVKLITSTVEKDELAMKTMTQDVQTLRGRHGGSVPLVATECSMRQASCSDCLSVPSCVWCKVEQRCYSGDSAGPVRGECAFFNHGTCS